MTDEIRSPRADINHFELLGFVGRIRAASTPSGREVANLSVATHHLVREPESRKLIEHTEWHDLVAFDEWAALVRQSVRKGTRVRAIGYMRTRSWIDRKTEKKQFKRELVVTELGVIEAPTKDMPDESENLDAPATGVKITSF